MLVLSAGLALLNTQKMHGLRARVVQADNAQSTAEQLQVAREKDLKGREAAVAAANARFGETRTKIASSEADLLKAQKENSDLQAKLRENETEIFQLLKRLDAAEGKPVVTVNSPAASIADLRMQLDEAKKQLGAAEREKTLLTDRIKAAQERSTSPETEKQKRLPAGGIPGIRGTVLAVNRAYNFVVLNLGGRQGVEPNTEMLVLRGGSFIGKIRISSVEPATAIGDIITSSLARGVQVQPGDIVIYAGTNS
jgi:hypothetical protein